MFDPIGAGGMARVHLGRHVGPMGFCRTVALKRLLPQFVDDPAFVAMFLDEARLAARIQHPNVVSTLDVVIAPKELVLVMEYIHGATLSTLVKRSDAIPPAMVSAVITDALYGLHAAHEATDELGQPLSVVHRDVSPQNILVGVDGVTRVLDFGIAKATQRSQVTRDGAVKGKLAYMAPEQLRARHIDRRSDVFAAAVVTWELLTGRRLFDFDDSGAAVNHILNEPRVAPSKAGASTDSFDEVVLRGLTHDAADRFATAREMALAIEQACAPASDAEVGAWAESLAGPMLASRRNAIRAIERIDVEKLEQEITQANALGHTFRSALSALRREDERADAETEVENDEVETHTDAVVAPRRPKEMPRWQLALAAVTLGAGAAVAAMIPFVSPDTPMVPAVATFPTVDVVIDPPRPTATHTATATTSAAPAKPPPVKQPLPEPVVRDCSPPYDIDADGTKRFKRHCL